MRKRKKTRSSTHPGTGISKDTLQTVVSQAEVMLDKGRYQEAILLLEPLVASHARSADLHTLLGSVYAQAGELWKGAEQYEQSLSLRRDANVLAALGIIYLDLELKTLAWQALRQALKSGAQEPPASELQEIITQLEDEIFGLVLLLNLPLDKAEKGLRLFEEGQIALHNLSYSRSLHLNRQAIRILGDFPPPHNNLSLALFYQGMPEEAIRTARQVIAQHPDNIMALSNLVCFLAWSGDTEAARQVWELLKPLSPYEDSTRMKMVEAAAIMEADEDVYRLLQDMGEERDQELNQHKQLYLAVAEANTNRPSAKSRLKALQSTTPWAGEILKDLQAGKPGLGIAERFPYFHATELLPYRELEAFTKLLGREDKMTDAQFRREVARFITRFPQLVLFGKKILWEDEQTDVAIGMLKAIGTPEAHAVLREFGLGQAGDDEARLQALFALVEAGQIPANETVRFWKEGAWLDIQLRNYEISEGGELPYASQVIDLLNEALLAFKKNRLSEAEKQYKHILTLEPRAKEAYNNLAIVYSRQEKYTQARAMLQKAIEIDPLYVVPRCNLALYLLDDEEIDKAEAMIAPLADLTRFSSQEMALLSYVQARIHLHRDEIDLARNSLEMALKVYPDYELAQNLLEHLDAIDRLNQGWEGFMEERRQRDQARRNRQRTLLTTPDPTLAEALGIYTKDILTAIARSTIPWGGWSGLKKAQLHQYLVDYLQEEGSLAGVLESLARPERAAFEHVQANGGTLAWDLFDQKFGNDLDESPYWHYHEPESVMGRLRVHGLLVEVTVAGKLLVSIPVELRRQTPAA
jgi:tetratricopeptide (TPR) repeat protein